MVPHQTVGSSFSGHEAAAVAQPRLRTEIAFACRLLGPSMRVAYLPRYSIRHALASLVSQLCLSRRVMIADHCCVSGPCDGPCSCLVVISCGDFAHQSHVQTHRPGTCPGRPLTSSHIARHICASTAPAEGNIRHLDLPLWLWRKSCGSHVEQSEGGPPPDQQG